MPLFVFSMYNEHETSNDKLMKEHEYAGERDRHKREKIRKSSRAH